jgi:hypothetical protein
VKLGQAAREGDPEIFDVKRTTWFELLCGSRLFWLGFAFWIGSTLGLGLGFYLGVEAAVG